ncbi:MAG: GHKL domain-containing protein [Cyclobacteriaceae bacterium]|nr:GHKL domain-containing protein [Cyclobacteriaceae bacterium]
MKNLLLAWIVVLPWCVQAQSEIGLPLATHYDMKMKETLSTWRISEQPNGSLYIAAELLLAQYDGVKFTTMAKCQAACLAVDADGTAYVGGGGEFGKVEVSPKGKYSYSSLSDLLDDSVKLGAVRNVWITSKYVYFCTIEAIFEYHKNSKQIKIYQPEANGLFFNGFVVADEFFISQRPVGLQKIVNGKFVLAPNGEKLNQVRTSMDWKAGEKLIGYGRDGRMITYSYSNSAPPTPFVIKPENYLLGDAIYDSYPIDKNYFVVGTIAHGALLIDAKGAIAKKYNDTSFFQGNRVVTVTKDRSKNIWIGYYGMNGKLSKTELGLDLSIWNKNNGLTGSVITSTRYQGVRYVGTDNNLFYIDKNNQAISILPNIQRVIQLSNFKIEGEEKLIAVTDQFHHLLEVKGNKVEQIFKGLEITAVAQSKIHPNRLYVSMRDTLLALRYENKRFVKEGIIDLSKGNYRQILEDKEGTLWLLEDNNFGAAARIDFVNRNSLQVKSISRFTSKNGLPDYCHLVVYLNGQLVIGGNRGLVWYNSNTQRCEPYCGLGQRFCSGKYEVKDLVQASDGSIYVLPLFPSDKNEIVQIRVNSKGDTTYENRPFKRLPEFGYFSDIKLEDQVLWISGTEGLIRYEPRLDTKNYDLDFQCLIRGVVSAKDTLVYGGLSSEAIAKQHIYLPYSKNTIVIEFAATFFDNESKTLYATQLEGAEEEWTDWDKTTLRNYSRLSEGDYTFKVKAKNVYGKESTIATYTFTILPPWFRTWWAYTIYGVALALFIFGVVRWRTISLRRKKKALESLVKEKTIELMESNKNLEASQEELKQNNEELIAINEHLKATHRQLATSEKMASLGQLTAGIAHEINNPMNFISGGVQALQEIQKDFLANAATMTPAELEVKRQEIDELMQTVNNGVHRATNIIKSLRTFSSPVDIISEHASVDLVECVETALVLMNSKLVSGRVQLIKKFNEVSTAKANAAQLSQVLVNLLDNAIYAVKDKTEKVITIAISENEEALIIRVKDTGIGIKEEEQQHIFEPFYTTKGVGIGTGLGLFISYSIIQRHNGKFTMESVYGVGTQFTILLPKSTKA